MLHQYIYRFDVDDVFRMESHTNISTHAHAHNDSERLNPTNACTVSVCLCIILFVLVPLYVSPTTSASFLCVSTATATATNCLTHRVRYKRRENSIRIVYGVHLSTHSHQNAPIYMIQHAYTSCILAFTFISIAFGMQVLVSLVLPTSFVNCDLNSTLSSPSRFMSFRLKCMLIHVVW